jgi:TetR/AcrR family transcriptional regulator, repressor of the ameABC operon
MTAAERLFRENGIAGCSIAHIAQALSMSPANVFKHFHSKMALVDAICERQIDRMVETLQTFDLAGPAPGRLRTMAHRLMQAHIDSLRDSPYMLEMIFLLSGTELTSGKRYKTMLDALFLSLVRHGVETGVYFTGDPERSSRAVSAALVSVIHPLFLAYTPAEDVRARCDEIVEMINCALQNPLAK